MPFTKSSRTSDLFTVCFSKLSLLAVTLTLASCSNLPRQYDGNLGYQIIDKNSHALTVRNIQEHRRTPESTEQEQIRNLCAKELNANTSSIQLKPLQRDVVSAEIAMPTMIPTSVKTDNVSGVMDVHGGDFITDGTKKKTTLRKTQFRCKIKVVQ